jgi:hypothetical protein
MASTPEQLDDRPAPRGRGTDARLARWLVDNVPNPAVRLDHEEENAVPVTMSSAELGALLYQVADRFYFHGVDDALGRGV